MAIKQFEKIDGVISNINMVYRAFIIPLMLFHAYQLLHIDYKHKSHNSNF